MIVVQRRTEASRKRLSSNHNETIVIDRTDRARKRLSSNHNETIVVAKR